MCSRHSEGSVHLRVSYWSSGWIYNSCEPSLCSAIWYVAGCGGKNANLELMWSTTLLSGPLQQGGLHHSRPIRQSSCP